MASFAITDLETPVGILRIVATEKGIAAVATLRGGSGSFAAWAARRLAGMERVPTLPHGVAARDQLREYFAGERRAFELPLDARGTPFQQSVWRALLDVPFGATATYADIAHRIGKARGAERAVGAANGANPIAIVVPCHRVVGADGSLTGYAGGMAMKEALLAHERSICAKSGLAPRGPTQARL